MTEEELDRQEAAEEDYKMAALADEAEAAERKEATMRKLGPNDETLCIIPGCQRLAAGYIPMHGYSAAHCSEHAAAARFHDQEPGRWGDHASPARMRRDIERDREEDRYGR